MDALVAPAIRDRLGEPSEVVGGKQLDHLDPHAAAFVAASPFVVLASADARGDCDSSPRGDGPGFVAMLDARTLLFPERRGNKRADTLVNVAETGQLGALFLIPGVNETLRVNGSADVIEDRTLLEPLASHGRIPELGLRLHVEEVFLHCARAFLRSRLWDPASWPDERPVASLGTMLQDQSAGRHDGRALDAVAVEDAKDLG